MSEALAESPLCIEVRTRPDELSLDPVSLLDHLVGCAPCRTFMAERTCD